jgi:hypothetical protein
MVLKFAAIFKALTDDNLFVINQNAQRFTTTCHMVGDMSVAEFEESGRLHILESLC